MVHGRTNIGQLISHLSLGENVVQGEQWGLHGVFSMFHFLLLFYPNVQVHHPDGRVTTHWTCPPAKHTAVCSRARGRHSSQGLNLSVLIIVPMKSAWIQLSRTHEKVPDFNYRAVVLALEYICLYSYSWKSTWLQLWSCSTCTRVHLSVLILVLMKKYLTTTMEL